MLNYAYIVFHPSIKYLAVPIGRTSWTKETDVITVWKAQVEVFIIMACRVDKNIFIKVQLREKQSV